MAKRTNIDEATKVKRDFAMRLKTVRVSAGYASQKAFALALGMQEPETYRRWERGETEPGVAFLNKIAKLTGVSLDFLIAGKMGDAQPGARPFIQAS